jgi:hypothetical protein
MAAESSDVKPWSIRGVPPEERNAAVEAAKRSDVPVGDWVARAIRTAIQAEVQASRAPVVVGPPASDRETELSDVERIAGQLRDLAAAGALVNPKHVSRVTASLVGFLPKRGAPRVRRNGHAGQTATGEASDD